MALAAQVLIGLLILLHVYIVLLETVLFKTRGRRVFGLDAARAEMVPPPSFPADGGPLGRNPILCACH
jgi:putative membrane protein